MSLNEDSGMYSWDLQSGSRATRHRHRADDVSGTTRCGRPVQMGCETHCGRRQRRRSAAAWPDVRRQCYGDLRTRCGWTTHWSPMCGYFYPGLFTEGSSTAKIEERAARGGSGSALCNTMAGYLIAKVSFFVSPPCPPPTVPRLWARRSDGSERRRGFSTSRSRGGATSRQPRSGRGGAYVSR